MNKSEMLQKLIEELLPQASGSPASTLPEVTANLRELIRLIGSSHLVKKLSNLLDNLINSENLYQGINKFQDYYNPMRVKSYMKDAVRQGKMSQDQFDSQIIPKLRDYDKQYQAVILSKRI